MTFEFDLSFDLHKWEDVEHLYHVSILKQEAQLLRVTNHGVFNTYRYALSGRGYTLLSMHGNLLKLLSKWTEPV